MFALLLAAALTAPTPIPTPAAPVVRGPVVVPSFPTSAPLPAGVHLESVRIFSPSGGPGKRRLRPPAMPRSEREARLNLSGGDTGARSARAARYARYAALSQVWHRDRRVIIVPLRSATLSR